MANKNAADLREMSDEQLVFELRETQQELFRLRFQASSEKLDAPSSLTKLRRKIARIKTIQQERESTNETGQTEEQVAVASD